MTRGFRIGALLTLALAAATGGCATKAPAREEGQAAGNAPAGAFVFQTVYLLDGQEHAMAPEYATPAWFLLRESAGREICMGFGFARSAEAIRGDVPGFDASLLVVAWLGRDETSSPMVDHILVVHEIGGGQRLEHFADRPAGARVRSCGEGLLLSLDLRDLEGKAEPRSSVAAKAIPAARRTRSVHFFNAGTPRAPSAYPVPSRVPSPHGSTHRTVTSKPQRSTWMNSVRSARNCCSGRPHEDSRRRRGKKKQATRSRPLSIVTSSRAGRCAVGPAAVSATGVKEENHA